MYLNISQCTGCIWIYLNIQGVSEYISIYRVYLNIFQYTGCPWIYLNIQGVPGYISIYRVSLNISQYTGYPYKYISIYRVSLDISQYITRVTVNISQYTGCPLVRGSESKVNTYFAEKKIRKLKFNSSIQVLYLIQLLQSHLCIWFRYHRTRSENGFVALTNPCDALAASDPTGRKKSQGTEKN